MSGQHLAQPSPARQLVAQANQQVKALTAQTRAELLAELAQLRELCRPARGKSQYPKARTLLEKVEQLEETAGETLELYRQLKGSMRELWERARREQQKRGSVFPFKLDD